MIRCMIIDDEPSAIDSLSHHIVRCPMLELVGTSTNGARGFDLVNSLRPDLVFVDVRLGDTNGLDLTRWIGSLSNVILCTGYPEYAVTGFDLNVVDYLLKPVEFDRFALAVQKMNLLLNGHPPRIHEPPGGFLFVKSGTRGARVRIDLNDISYIRAMNNYVAFHVSYGRVFAHLSLKEVEYRLPMHDFMRVQKSYIVALSEIASLENNELVMKRSGIRIPISGSYKEQFLERVKQHEL